MRISSIVNFLKNIDVWKERVHDLEVRVAQLQAEVRRIERDLMRIQQSK